MPVNGLRDASFYFHLVVCSGTMFKKVTLNMENVMSY